MRYALLAVCSAGLIAGQGCGSRAKEKAPSPLPDREPRAEAPDHDGSLLSEGDRSSPIGDIRIFRMHRGPPAHLSYSDAVVSYPVGRPITENLPSSTGGAIDSYAVEPRLPPGISLDPATGVLSGAPTQTTALSVYTVTGRNSEGSALAAVSIAVHESDGVKLGSGTILVGTEPDTCCANTDQSHSPRGIVAVDPNSGRQSLFSGRSDGTRGAGLLYTPYYLALGRGRQLYVVEAALAEPAAPFKSGAIIQVDMNSSEQRLLAQGGDLDGPAEVVFIEGAGPETDRLYVACIGDATTTSSESVHRLVEIDLNPARRGAQRLVSRDDQAGFTIANGMARSLDGRFVYLSDEPGNISGCAQGRINAIWRIDVETGESVAVSKGSLLSCVQDLVVEGNGKIIVETAGADGSTGRLVEVDPFKSCDPSTDADNGCRQSQVLRHDASGAAESFLYVGGVNGMAIDSHGTLYMSLLTPLILSFDRSKPSPDDIIVLARGGKLSNPTGLVVLP